MPPLQDLRLLLRIICPMSIVLNLGVMIWVVYHKKKQSCLGWMQFFLATSDIWLAISWIIENEIATNQPFCNTVGTLNQFFINASSCWSALIACYCYFIVFHNQKTADSYWKWYNAYGWGIPLLLTIALFISGVIMNRGDPLLGDATYQCWISAKYPELRVALYYPLLWIHFCVILVIYIRIFIVIQVTNQELTVSFGGVHAHHHGRQLRASEASKQSITAPRISHSVSPPNPAKLSRSENGSEDDYFQVPPQSIHHPHNSLSRTINYHDKTATMISTYSTQNTTHHAATDDRVSVTVYPSQSQTQSHQTTPTITPPPVLRKSSVRKRSTVTSLKSSPQERLNQTVKKLILKSSIITIGFIISWTPATASRILSLVPGAVVPEWLSILMAVGFALSGLWNSGAFLIGLIWDYYC
ncbi:hypothetical protein BDR26DRAFT_918272 [Obelidium mucronatum]|nr:hypothetical protein BDR26DRAFT_918272 [Obelidium mucronatum]